MNPKSVKSLSYALIGLLLFLAVLVLARLYSSQEVPVQFAGALLGAIVTAAITMALLHGQTQAEETKERNVKVFEEKTRRYNEFLGKLWQIWQDRRVTLEELNELMELVSRDIIIYTKAENTKKILGSLTKIAEFSGLEETMEKNQQPSEDAKLKMQGYVFDIIDTISAEMGLGGSLTPAIRSDLDKLEEKIRPLLVEKERKARIEILEKQCRQDLLDNVWEVLEKAQLQVELLRPEYNVWSGLEYLCVPIEQSPVQIRVGPMRRKGDIAVIMAFHVEFYHNRKFAPFRDAAKGWRKDYLGPIRYWGANDWYGKIMPDFSDEQSMIEWTRRSGGIEVGNLIVKHLFKNWPNSEDGKIKDIIETCCD